MLKLAGHAGTKPFRVERNAYLPLSLTLLPEVLSLDEVLYWRSTNSTSLLQFKLHASSGELASVELVLVAPERIATHPPVLPALAPDRVKSGLPCFDRSPWQTPTGASGIGLDPRYRWQDVDLPFVAYIGPRLTAVMFDGAAPDSAVKNGDLALYFDAGERLCGFGVEQSSPSGCTERTRR